MSTELAVVRLGFGYPHPDALVNLGTAIGGLPTGSVRDAMAEFAERIEPLDLGEWEELHTRTLDLSPLFVPYVGHITWGESYRRGAFMADLQRAQVAMGVDQGGELPDHLAPILGYLAAATNPLPDLVEALPGAVAVMKKDLEKADPDNPYRHLLRAVEAAVHNHLSEGAPA